MKPCSTTPDEERVALLMATPSADLAAAETSHDGRLDSCSELEWIVVRTRNSTYEIIVLSGDTGDVMVRGGEFFKEFTHATVGASIFGETADPLRSICAGGHLELRLDGKRFVTSRIERVSCHRLPVCEGAA